VSEPARMLDGTRRPTEVSVAAWIGARAFKRWSDLRRFIDAGYPGVFNVDWQFGGRKHGWSLRFRKSKSFCTLVPERGRLRVLIVFGRAEREAAEGLLPRLASHVADDYRSAATYADGKWMLVTVDSAKALADVQRLLEVKRRPAARRS